jgi:hypothetical protein
VNNVAYEINNMEIEQPMPQRQQQKPLQVEEQQKLQVNASQNTKQNTVLEPTVNFVRGSQMTGRCSPEMSGSAYDEWCGWTEHVGGAFESESDEEDVYYIPADYFRKKREAKEWQEINSKNHQSDYFVKEEERIIPSWLFKEDNTYEKVEQKLKRRKQSRKESSMMMEGEDEKTPQEEIVDTIKIKGKIISQDKSIKKSKWDEEFPDEGFTWLRNCSDYIMGDKWDEQMKEENMEDMRESLDIMDIKETDEISRISNDPDLIKDSPECSYKKKKQQISHSNIKWCNDWMNQKTNLHKFYTPKEEKELDKMDNNMQLENKKLVGKGYCQKDCSWCTEWEEQHPKL